VAWILLKESAMSAKTLGATLFMGALVGLGCDGSDFTDTHGPAGGQSSTGGHGGGAVEGTGGGTGTAGGSATAGGTATAGGSGTAGGAGTAGGRAGGSAGSAGGSATAGGSGTAGGSATAGGAATGGSSSDPIFVGAGDISACGSGVTGEQTAKILDGLFANGQNANGLVFTTGDNAYEDGTLAQYTSCYDPSWGRHKARTRPSAGNHEWHTAGAAGYFQYWGMTGFGDPAKGAYYSYDLGAWHIIVIDANVSSSPGSDQGNWLQADLAAHPAKCTLAYWHQSRFSSGYHGSSTYTQDAWQALYDANADVVLSGHDHHYERFAPQTATGTLDMARGIRGFVVGTGGDTTYAINTPIANSELRHTGNYGVLKLTLHADSYDWEYLSEAGQTFTDSGTGQCH
jgi:hypothetical protein